jgi:hypothetical protein
VAWQLGPALLANATGRHVVLFSYFNQKSGPKVTGKLIARASRRACHLERAEEAQLKTKNRKSVIPNE